MIGLTQTEAREEIVEAVVTQIEEAREAFPKDGVELRAYAESVATEAVKRIQDKLAGPLDALANTLWSNETRGTAGRLSNLRRDAHTLIDAADQIVGKYRD